MNRVYQVVNYLVFLSFMFLLGSGLLLSYRLPPRSRGEAVLTLTRHEWGDLHFYASWAMVIFITLHLYLNRSWFKGLMCRIGILRFAIGLGFGLLAIVAPLVL